MKRILAIVLGVAAVCVATGIVAQPAAAELVPGGWLQPPTHLPEPTIPPPAVRPPAVPPAAPVSAPRRPAPHRPAQAPRMRAPAQPPPPSDGQVRF